MATLLAPAASTWTPITLPSFPLGMEEEVSRSCNLANGDGFPRVDPLPGAQATTTNLDTMEDGDPNSGGSGKNSQEVTNDDTQESSDSDQESSWCPLFMEGLPKNFASNPQLAAIASLLDDDEAQEEEDRSQRKPAWAETHQSTVTEGSFGGGKDRSCARRIQRRQRQNLVSPYQAPKKPSKRPQASMGEAQLFLKMWKL